MHEFRLELAKQVQKVPSPDSSCDSPNTNYIVGNRRIRARAAIQAVTKKEARKRPKKKLVLEVSNNNDDDSTNNKCETSHPELAGGTMDSRVWLMYGIHLGNNRIQ
jgi:hypothetical protein